MYVFLPLLNFKALLIFVFVKLQVNAARNKVESTAEAVVSGVSI